VDHLTPLQRVELTQHVNRIKAHFRTQLEEALKQQEARIRELLQAGQEVTLNLRLEVVQMAKTS